MLEYGGNNLLWSEKTEDWGVYITPVGGQLLTLWDKIDLVLALRPVGQGFGQSFPFILTIFYVDIHYCSRLLEIVQRIGMQPTIVEFR